MTALEPTMVPSPGAGWSAKGPHRGIGSRRSGNAGAACFVNSTADTICSAAALIGRSRKKMSGRAEGTLVEDGRGLGPHGARGRLVGEDLAVADMDDAVGVFGDIGLVSHQHDGVALAVELVEQRHDLHARL